MNYVQLGGLIITALAVCFLLASLGAYVFRAVAKLAKQRVERWDGFYARWPARFMILGVFGMALGYGMMWGPSLMVGAKLKREQAEQTQ